MNVVFMGTPDFAVQSLQALLNAGHHMQAVFTQPDKPVGRKQLLTPPPVKAFAMKKNIPVYQPQSVRTPEVLEQIRTLQPDVCAVVAYGKLLPAELLQIPKHGCINVHASLLPKYRGAAPIQWAIVHGEQTTGVTTMQLDAGMDTGDILLQAEESIHAQDTVQTLGERLAVLGATLLCKTLTALEQGSVTPQPQNAAKATYAPIIQKEDGLIDWNRPAGAVDCLIRGLNTWPTAFTFADGKRLKIFQAHPIEQLDAVPGEIICQREQLLIGCGQNTALQVLDLQLEGSKRMQAADFLRGKQFTCRKFG